jgi:NADPH-dependent curcumin reductase CurA
MWGWREYAVSDGRGVERVDPSVAPISTALGVLGMPGRTAYFGMLDVGRIRPGESVFVSGAAGAVGSVAAQIAKIGGCRVAGSAGSAEKVKYLEQEVGVNSAFNYRDFNDLALALKEACPDGIDVYFDNVGGPLSDAVFRHLNMRARVVICGQIDMYNATEVPMGPRVLFHLTIKRARAEGFLVFDYAHRYGEARKRMAQWIREGKITYRETITDGIENVPKAFIGLFTGENIGKQLVRVTDDR